MIKVLLVDDESMALEYLKNLTDWEGNGFELIGTARDFDTAMRLFHRYRPDLILSDVRMPGRTGLDFIAEIRQIDANARVLFLSGYEDFEYARRAIHLGADDYILKSDLNEESLLSRLLPLREKMIREAEMRKYSVQSAFEDLFQRNLDERYFSKLMSPGDYIKITRKYYCIIFTIRHAPDFMHEIFRDYSDSCYDLEDELKRRVIAKADECGCRFIAGFSINQRDYLAVMDLKQPTASETKIAGCLREYAAAVCRVPDRNRICAFYLSRSCSIRHFSRYYRENQLTILSGSLRRGCYVGEFTASDSLGKDCADAKRVTEEELVQDIRSKSFTKCMDCVRMVERSIEESDSVAYLWYVKILLRAMLVFDGEVLNAELRMHFSVYEHSEEYHLYVAEEMAAFLKKKVEALKSACAGETNARYSPNISKAIRYIRDHYQSPELSAAVVAGHISLSESWLSTKFREEVGVGLTDYINMTRIEAARRILQTTDDMIYEIAERCGFTSSQYFSKVFKSIVGITPNRYRKEQASHGEAT